MRSRHRPAPAAIGRSALLLAVARSALVLLRYSPPLCRSSPPRLMSSSSKIPGSLPPSRSIPAAAMDGESPAPPRGACLLVLCGKSDAEKDRARSMASEHNLKLLDAGEEIAVSLLPYSDGAANPTNPPPKMTFRAQRYMDALSTSRFGRLLLWSPRLPSTHDVVSQNFCELPLGSVCVADIQAKGRGRSKNVWESPPGCLMFSFTLQMEDGRAVPLVQYVVSLAVTEAIKDVCRAKDLPFLGVKIKWPNDLYLNGLKVGGILCTSTYRSKSLFVYE
uniref:Biotin--protein ligase n=1 Tax=Anthurium amnicola TaxID=1678845 RepID=A0A1D1XW64_9ARAE